VKPLELWDVTKIMYAAICPRRELACVISDLHREEEVREENISINPWCSDCDRDCVGNDIALAISFPREDSYLAAQTLISLGPDITATTLPILIDNLHRQRPAPRLYSAFVLGMVGKAASCSVGDIGPLLWDADPSVHSAIAYALARITGEDLFPDGAMVSEVSAQTADRE